MIVNKDEKKVEEKDEAVVAEETKENVETEKTEEKKETSEDVIASLNEEIKKKDEEIAKLKNAYAMAYADTENTRKRLVNEYEQKQKYHIQSFAKEVLPVLDNCERALAQATQDEAYRKGVEMIYNQLKTCLEKEYGVTLFIRNSQGVILTDSGKKVVEKAEEIIKKTNDLNRFLYNNDKETINVKLAVPRSSYISVAFCNTVEAFENNKLNISYKECNNTDILNDVMINGYNLGIIRIPTELEAKYKKMITSKQIQFQEIWNFKYKILFSQNHPLAKRFKRLATPTTTRLGESKTRRFVPNFKGSNI